MNKGKGRGPPPPVDNDDDQSVEITLSSSDESDSAFFGRAFRPVAVRNTRSPSPIMAMDEDEDGSMKRRKRRPAPVARKKASPLPVSTRKAATSENHKALGSQSKEPISLLSSSDEESAPSKRSKGKGKGKRNAREWWTPELTPPPELLPEQKELMSKQVAAYLEETSQATRREALAAVEAQRHEKNRSPQPAAVPTGSIVQIRVRMVADPDRKTGASQKAIDHYERPRVVNMRRNEPLLKLAESIAHRLEKPTSDLMFTHNGTRIFALSQTPRDRGIFDEAEFKGYERSLWEKMQKEREAERQRQLNPSLSPALAPSADEGNGDSDAFPLDELPDDGKIRITLRGATGQFKLVTQPTTKVIAVLRLYCTKFDLDPARAGAMHLSIDGERFSGDTPISELDTEEGDMIDVV